VLLLVSVGVAGLVELVGLPYSLLNLAACVAAFVLLLRAPVRAWFRRDGVGPSAPPAAGWPPPGSPPPPAQQPVPQHQPPADHPSGKPPVW
jgi:hypothetical protein